MFSSKKGAGDPSSAVGAVAPVSRDVEAEATRETMDHELELKTKAIENDVECMADKGMLGEGMAMRRVRLMLEQRAKRKLALQFHPYNGSADRKDEERQRAVNRVTLEVQQRVLSRRFPRTILKLECDRECFRCKATFQLCNSLGKWQCLYHPGRVDQRNGRWTCCGRSHYYSSIRERSGGLDGCTRCDHSDRFRTRVGVAAYRVQDAELSALIDPLPEAVRSSLEYENVADHSRWAGGPILELVSKEDLGQKPASTPNNLDFMGPEDDIREQDALAVARARPRPHGTYVDTPYVLSSLDSDPTARRGEVMTAEEAFAHHSAARTLLNDPGASYAAHKRAQPSARKIYYVLAASLVPDHALVRRAGL